MNDQCRVDEGAERDSFWTVDISLPGSVNLNNLEHDIRIINISFFVFSLLFSSHLFEDRWRTNQGDFLLMRQISFIYYLLRLEKEELLVFVRSRQQRISEEERSSEDIEENRLSWSLDAISRSFLPLTNVSMFKNRFVVFGRKISRLTFRRHFCVEPLSGR